MVETREMKSTLALEFILRTIHFLQDLTLFPDLPIPANSSSLVQTQDPSSHISPMPPHSWEEKCESEGERGIKKLRFNLERKDWNLEKDYGEELIIVKSAYDQETKTNLLLTEVVITSPPPPSIGVGWETPIKALYLRG
ncbi:unnamed protein product [Darwinula stevensoni]|uniref:Uncharacterized protein n=1 Tax=Darwinula stevensoni TaxID=69355 RepID=A0A7R9AEK2_9CRUS|nr:unnamed protein product [Darwinula stevensoni]CAG0902114.1 unnamed protein product [Darwinula stevensoni]